MKFDSYSEEWLDFILNCRSRRNASDYDIVIGGVANDKVFNTVVELFAKKTGKSVDAALNFFYHSKVYELMSEGISDMHCMSDEYLAEELELEYKKGI